MPAVSAIAKTAGIEFHLISFTSSQECRPEPDGQTYETIKDPIARQPFDPTHADRR